MTENDNVSLEETEFPEEDFKKFDSTQKAQRTIREIDELLRQS